jgi:hypothetical protein
VFAVLNKILPVDYLDADEIFLKISMDDAGSLGGFGIGWNSPGTRFFGPEVKKVIRFKSL